MWCAASERDVLASHARFAEKLDADIIVQASSDAPFVDAGLVDSIWLPP